MTLRFFIPTPGMVPVFAGGMGGHMLPLLRVASERRCDLGLLDQGCKAFTLPTGRAWVVIIGDDPAEPEVSFGPRGFHRPSVRALLKHADDVSLISCEIIPMVYERAAALAAIGLSSVIIETRPVHDPAWTRHVHRAAGRKLRTTARVAPNWRFA